MPALWLSGIPGEGEYRWVLSAANPLLPAHLGSGIGGVVGPLVDGLHIAHVDDPARPLLSHLGGQSPAGANRQVNAGVHESLAVVGVTASAAAPTPHLMSLMGASALTCNPRRTLGRQVKRWRRRWQGHGSAGPGMHVGMAALLAEAARHKRSKVGERASCMRGCRGGLAGALTFITRSQSSGLPAAASRQPGAGTLGVAGRCGGGTSGRCVALRLPAHV